MGWLRSKHDLDDERVLIGVTGGALWLVGAIAAALAQLLPAAPGVDAWWYAFDGAIALWGIVSIVGPIDWTRWSVERHALASAALMPLLGVTLWVTGGEDSYLQPILVLPLLHVAYFFRAPRSIPLIAELIAVEASPLLYSSGDSTAYTSRLLAFAVAASMLTVIVRQLKTRLVAAEARQRQMALGDALTGLANRRHFDLALHDAVMASGDRERGRREDDHAAGFALILIDLDRFKDVNDTQGHQAGDRLLRRVAAHCASVVRPSDVLARIGGDEFAVIAPGAGPEGAERLAHKLLGAVHSAGAEATVASAVHPADGVLGEDLLRTADRRLYEGKAALAVPA